MKRATSLFAMIALAASLAACGGSSNDNPAPSGTALKGYANCTAVDGEAVICGTVTAADGVTPIVGAEIRQLSASADTSRALKGIYKETATSAKGVPDPTACLSDGSGNFACGGITENGTYTFSITASGISISFSLTVAVDSTSTASASDTTASEGDLTEKWLVVSGAYDGVQLLLSQLKGCTLTGDATYPASLTSSDECTAVNLEVLEYADIAATFAALSNISEYDAIFVNCATDMAAYATVLQEFVAGGGNLYFSDLSDPGVTAAFPDKVTFGTSWSTSSGDITADIDYAPLATYLSASTMTVTFDLGGWMPIASVAAGVTTYISGDTSGIGGSADAPITVGWKEGTGGCVFYTSYHIEAASTGSSQENALKYLILNANEVCE